MSEFQFEYDDVEQFPWLRQAGAAFQCGMVGEYEEASRLLRAMQQEHGAETVAGAIIAWIDAALTFQGINDYGGTVALHFINMDGDGDGADNAPKEMVWAGRLFAARMADDREMFDAVINTIAGVDGKVVGDHVLAVLHTAVQLTLGNGRVKVGRRHHGTERNTGENPRRFGQPWNGLS